METKEETMLNTEHVMATRPPIRAMLSNPGKDMSVTEALRMIADYGSGKREVGTRLGNLTTKQAQAPTTNRGVVLSGR